MGWIIHLVVQCAVVLIVTSLPQAPCGKPYCTLKDKHVCYPDGTLTTGRCSQYKCINGAWEIWSASAEHCRNCETSRKTTIRPYDVHRINGDLIYSYPFDGSVGTYCLTQYGIGYPSSPGVKMTFADTGNNETSITKVLYAETGITVALVSPGPNYAVEIMVNGSQLNLNRDGTMIQLQSAVGTVWLSVDSPIRPSDGVMYITGSQGLTVTIRFWDGYAQRVNSWAMPSLETNLYGLCDVFTDGYPEHYTMLDGVVTTDIITFTESWKIGVSAPTCDCKYAIGEELMAFGCVITEAAPNGTACHCHLSEMQPYRPHNPCSGSVTTCEDETSPHCTNPGTGYESCLQGQGNCEGYSVSANSQ